MLSQQHQLVSCNYSILTADSQKVEPPPLTCVSQPFYPPPYLRVTEPLREPPPGSTSPDNRGSSPVISLRFNQEVRPSSAAAAMAASCSATLVIMRAIDAWGWCGEGREIGVVS